VHGGDEGGGGAMKEIGFAVWDLLNGIELAAGSMIFVGSVLSLT
jgi:hypothetical protein